MRALSEDKIQKLIKEAKIVSSRSGGPGGQNVNKVNTKVTLRFKVSSSEVLNETQKRLLLKKLSSRLSTDGMLIVSSQEERSQIQNKEIVIKKFCNLVQKNLKPQKPRKATKPTKASKEKRLKEKKEVSEKKKWRGKID